MSSTQLLSTAESFLSLLPSDTALLYCPYLQHCFWSPSPYTEAAPQKVRLWAEKGVPKKRNRSPLESPASAVSSKSGLHMVSEIKIPTQNLPVFTFSHLFAYFPIPSNTPILSWWFEVVPLPENTRLRRWVLLCALDVYVQAQWKVGQWGSLPSIQGGCFVSFKAWV